MTRLSTTSRMVLSLVFALTGLVAVDVGAASAASAASTGPVISDYLEAHATFDKNLKNVPRGGWNTHVHTSITITLGYQTGDSGRKAPYNQVCVDIEKSVQDAQGNSVVLDPSGRDPSDGNCVDLPSNASATIASDLSTASVNAPSVPLIHTTWNCPDGPDGDCSAVQSPGPVVAVRATWRALKPVFVGSFCLGDHRTWSTIAERDADATATIDGVDAGPAEAGDEGVRIAHWTDRLGCATTK